MNQPLLTRRQEAWKHFLIATGFALLMAAILAIFVGIKGKDDSFLLINHVHASPFDRFFAWYTYLGDGLVWIPIFAYVLLYHRKFFWCLVFALAICTFFTQISKYFVFADAMRPAAVLKERVHAVTGVELHYTSSFPSGHTSTAFTYALLMAYLLRRYFFTFFFPVVAIFVGYSRVYLAQHFVTDVLAGIMVGLTSAWLAILLYHRLVKKEAY